MNETYYALGFFKTYLKYNGLFMSLAIFWVLVVSFFAGIVWPIFVFVPFFTFMSLFSLGMKGLTKQIEFSGISVIVNRGSTLHFEQEELYVRPVVVKNWYHGMNIGNGAQSVTIWKYEFSNSDWVEIKNKLSTLTNLMKTDRDNTGWTS